MIFVGSRYTKCPITYSYLKQMTVKIRCTGNRSGWIRSKIMCIHANKWGRSKGYMQIEQLQVYMSHVVTPTCMQMLSHPHVVSWTVQLRQIQPIAELLTEYDGEDFGSVPHSIWKIWGWRSEFWPLGRVFANVVTPPYRFVDGPTQTDTKLLFFTKVTYWVWWWRFWVCISFYMLDMREKEWVLA